MNPVVGKLAEWRLERHRRRYLERCRDEVARTFLSAPLPHLGARAAELGFLVCDLETTGLDPRSDDVVCIGWVAVEDGRIRLSSARRRVVATERPMNASATIHGLVDTDVAGGVPLASALRELLADAGGRVMVYHHAPLDRGFLDVAVRRLYGMPFLAWHVDTLATEHRLRDRRGEVPADGALRLSAVRQRYGLPRYRAHDALVDAVATAEVLLAQLEHRGGAEKVPLAALIG
jgi:DNA polymerase-3 subunit epsilon